MPKAVLEDIDMKWQKFRIQIHDPHTARFKKNAENTQAFTAREVYKYLKIKGLRTV